MSTKESYSIQFSYGMEEDHMWFKRFLVNSKGRIVESAEVVIYNDGSYRKKLHRLRRVNKTPKNRFNPEHVEKLRSVVRAFLEENVPDHIKVPVLEHLFYHFFNSRWIDYAYKVTYPFIRSLEVSVA